MTKTTAAPTAAKPSAAKPTASKPAPVKPPAPDEVETSTAATGVNYLKKSQLVPVNFKSEFEDHQAVKVWCAEHGMSIYEVYIQGAKMFMASKQATRR